MTTYSSATFSLETMDLLGGTETILRGGRHLFPLLPQALRGISRIGVIGWGPQGRAQALNLRDSLAGTDITVAVGLRTGSTSAVDARASGFTEQDDTLGEWLEVTATSDLVLLLIADAAMATSHRELFARLKPGRTRTRPTPPGAGAPTASNPIRKPRTWSGGSSLSDWPGTARRGSRGR